MKRDAPSWVQALLATPGPHSPREYALLYAKAFAMGAADLIPGVSGGTIAFITGIYGQLLGAISSLNTQLLRDILSRRYRKAFSNVPLRFMAVMALGIGSALLSLSRLMHYLMLNHGEFTWAFFFGLIAASGIVIFRQLDTRGLGPCALVLAGGVFSYAIVGLVPVETPESWWFIFLCGVIGITAMILPGISGSFLLLILGKYEFIISALRAPFADHHPFILGIFMAGMATGLLAFSKILHRLMMTHRNRTMAFLTGILLGSLRKVWPWKSSDGGGNGWPMALDGEFALILGLIALGFALVFRLEGRSQ